MSSEEEGSRLVYINTGVLNARVPARVVFSR